MQRVLRDVFPSGVRGVLRTGSAVLNTAGEVGGHVGTIATDVYSVARPMVGFGLFAGYTVANYTFGSVVNYLETRNQAEPMPEQASEPVPIPETMDPEPDIPPAAAGEIDQPVGHRTRAQVAGRGGY